MKLKRKSKLSKSIILECFPKCNSNVCLVPSDEIKQYKLIIKLVSYGGYASECVTKISNPIAHQYPFHKISTPKITFYY